MSSLRNRIHLCFLLWTGLAADETVLGPNLELDILTAWRLISSIDLMEWSTRINVGSDNNDLINDFGRPENFGWERLPAGHGVEPFTVPSSVFTFCSDGLFIQVLFVTVVHSR